MASTKIINVLKDDKFEEILDLFKETSANEVIFVLPKKSKSFTNEEHFIILANEASKGGKKISVLCSSPAVNKMAEKYRFDILLTQTDKPSLITTVNQHPNPKEEEVEIEPETEQEKEPEQETLEEDDNQRTQRAEQSSNDGKPEPEPEEEAVAEEELEDEELVPTTSRGVLEDIVREGSGARLIVSSRKDKPVRLNVKKSSPKKHTAEFLGELKRHQGKATPIEDIQDVWNSQAKVEEDDKSIWAGLGLGSKKGYRVPWSAKARPGDHSETGRRKPLFQFEFANLSKKSVIVMGGVSILLLGTIIFVSTGSAKIDITPKKESLDTVLRVSASDKVSAVDQNSNKIPGQLFSIDKTISQTFPATGEKDVVQKARGKMRIYNAYGTASQVLIATTRFEKDGLIFRTLTTVTVPGTKVSNGEITPGSVEVEVVADKAGETYNISAGKFTIPAFKEKGDAGRYDKIYGATTEAMTGGKIGRAKVVTENDYNTAKQTLQDQLKKDIDEGLSTQTAGLKTIDKLSVKISEPESSARMDEAADSFTMSLKGSLKTVGFKQSDLDALIKQHVDKTRNMEVIPDKIQLSYKSIIFNDAENLLEFTIAISGNAYAKIDTAKIKREMVGKNENEIKAYLRSIPEVESAKVILSPFWVKRIPKNEEKVTLNIIY